MALSVVDRIRKRAFYPLTLVNGEKIHLRALTHQQLQVARSFSEKESSIGYAIGCSLLEDSSDPVFVPADEESPESFGERVMSALELGRDVQQQIVAKIFEITNEPEKVKAEALAKN